MNTPLISLAELVTRPSTGGSRPILAVPNTGRLFNHAAEVLRKTLAIDILHDRSLLHETAEVVVVCARSNDIPYLVGRGIATVGLTGYDYVVESGQPLTRVADLGLDPGRVCVLALPGAAGRFEVVASQYPRIATGWCADRQPTATVLSVAGAAELYPRLGLADAIVDNVTTGFTARDNGLVIADEILSTAGCLCVRDDLSRPSSVDWLIGVMRQGVPTSGADSESDRTDLTHTRNALVAAPVAGPEGVHRVE